MPFRRCCCLCCGFFLDLTRGILSPQRLREYKLALLRINSILAAFKKVWPPRDFVVFFVLFCFFWPNGVFFFFSGLVGFPLPCFSPPPVSWFWVVRLGIFACSCILHLSLAPRVTWSSDPQPPRPPQPLCLGGSCLARLLLGMVGGMR